MGPETSGAKDLPKMAQMVYLSKMNVLCKQGVSRYQVYCIETILLGVPSWANRLAKLASD